MAVWLAQWLGPLLLVSLWGLLAPASLLRRLGEHIQQFQESSAQGLGLSLGPGAAALPKVGWLEQLLDPFNVSDRRSFLQRYWVNDQHWVGQDGPIFLHLGGEGSLGPGSVMRGHPAALAPAWGALVISLEHRFYGLSIPAGGLEMAQLRFLSSRLALADVVSARLALSRLFNISSSSPWICFGGSYAGSLAAWARLKFPHLIFASVASSAPVRAVLDFSEYNDVVSRSLMSTAIGGSLEIVLHSLGQKCLSFSRAETVAQLRSTEPQLSGVGDRQWLYQTCTEFGFYVTCENPRCPFSQLPALPSQLDLCEQVFGLSALSVAQAVAQTNSYYGGQTPGANKVLFVNGDTDPWHVLSVTQALGSSESTLLIRTGSHCLDMAPERPSDSPSLRLGRQNIFQQLQTWLKLAKESQIKGEV
ncbi:thymus-specific serine protease isoform X3 [Homo sapiens]|uniref:thymus-specific serine protease isoform X3 n=1 Tax=Homo sapiens TaxID=9606 RepID=UPI0007DC61EC|nr:thymus-specific serine protease isoform X3 [Homo sapiens]|eukprot:XP_016865652.1 thymus-specific serine protease isoform X3 [Homo sapiens]